MDLISFAYISFSSQNRIQADTVPSENVFSLISMVQDGVGLGLEVKG